ncbi:MAG: hypothetical protein ABW194_01875 [Novosphingobium sp.]
MADTSDTAANLATTPGGTAPSSEAKTRFTAAIDEARAGVEALRGEAVDRTNAYRARAAEGAADWVEEVKTLSGQAKERAAQLASDGKSRASDGLAALSKTVTDNAPTIDEKLGVKYGDYARQAARSMQDVATRLETKDINELVADAREFIRTNPGAAIGAAAAAGYFIASLFRSRKD